MNELCRLIWCGLIGFFRSRGSLEAEILVLRHQLNILRRKSPQRPTFRSIDRLIFAGPYGLAPNALSALAIVRPETVIRWHGAGFRWYWRWKSKSPGGRPKLPVDRSRRLSTHQSNGITVRQMPQRNSFATDSGGKANIGACPEDVRY